jgi:hypothetical protein
MLSMVYSGGRRKSWCPIERGEIHRTSAVPRTVEATTAPTILPDLSPDSRVVPVPREIPGDLGSSSLSTHSSREGRFEDPVPVPIPFSPAPRVPPRPPSLLPRSTRRHRQGRSPTVRDACSSSVHRATRPRTSAQATPSRSHCSTIHLPTEEYRCCQH